MLEEKKDFAIETTLSSKNYLRLIEKARSFNYQVTLIFFWLNSVELAKERVKQRVLKGGHSIPPEVIERRYKKGILHLPIYIEKCDNWFIFDNSNKSKLIARKAYSEIEIIDSILWKTILKPKS